MLDFARPIRFDYAPADVNALCADAEQATRAGHQDMHVTIKPDPALETVVTDAERLRIGPGEHPDQRAPRRRRQSHRRSRAHGSVRVSRRRTSKSRHTRCRALSASPFAIAASA